MKVGDLSPDALRRQVGEGNLLIDLAPFVARLRCDVDSAVRNLASMYAAFSVLPSDHFADFHI